MGDRGRIDGGAFLEGFWVWSDDHGVGLSIGGGLEGRCSSSI